MLWMTSPGGAVVIFSAPLCLASSPRAVVFDAFLVFFIPSPSFGRSLVLLQLRSTPPFSFLRVALFLRLLSASDRRISRPQWSASFSYAHSPETQVLVSKVLQEGVGGEYLVDHHSIPSVHAALKDVLSQFLQLLFEVPYLPTVHTGSPHTRSRAGGLASRPLPQKC